MGTRPLRGAIPSDSTVKTMVSGEEGHSVRFSKMGQSHAGATTADSWVTHSTRMTYLLPFSSILTSMPRHQCNRFGAVAALTSQIPHDRPAVSVSVGGTHSCAVLDNKRLLLGRIR